MFDYHDIDNPATLKSFKMARNRTVLFLRIWNGAKQLFLRPFLNIMITLLIFVCFFIIIGTPIKAGPVERKLMIAFLLPNCAKAFAAPS